MNEKPIKFYGKIPEGKDIVEVLMKLLSIQQNVKRTYKLKEITTKKDL